MLTTEFTEEDDVLELVLDNLDKKKRDIILERLQLIEIENCFYGYLITNISEELIVEMLKNGFDGHFLYKDDDDSLKLLTKEVLKSDIQSIQHASFVVSGLYVITQAAKTFILKKQIEIVNRQN